MKIKKFAIPLAVVGMLAVGTSAWAGTTFQGYSTTVGKLNGNGYTAYQTKVGAGTAADLRSGTVGADYVVDARLQAAAGTGGWARDVGDNDTRQLWNSVQKGASARVQFSNDWNTAVDVQVSGTWRSN
ncbi:hypothetical protein PCC79_00745 [Propioniciclava soli]|uniref:Lactococcin 972 family bacteriocin n=2 Tax=Propioniciclava soli TaxID=2775081 RepID=A0ABZ3C7L1_9ACTN